MYRVGRHIRHSIWPYIIAGLLATGLLTGGYLVSKQMLKPNTVITQSPPVVKHVDENQSAMQHITKDAFTMDLPADWRPIPAPAIVANGFSWRGTVKDEADERLDVYVDRLPQGMAFNRLLPVQSSGDGLIITGSVSPKCNDFTDKTPQSVATGTAMAKWKGVNFICDMSNIEHDVTATGSVEEINTVSVTGSKTGLHHVLLVFTNNNINPDPSVFIAIVRSFHAV